MSTHSVIARPGDGDRIHAVYCHFDGGPSHQLPLLLTAYRYRFGQALDDMTRHLITDAPAGWDVLGTDLLAGAPEELRSRIAPYLDPSRKQATTDATSVADAPLTTTLRELRHSSLSWAYVLGQRGIDVIPLTHWSGPERYLVTWATDARSYFPDDPDHWVPPRRSRTARAAKPHPRTADATSPVPRRSRT
ncbi:hypothetical protein ACL02R_11575 [Streptomyces sp. MS19]|uniref:hypothetical protein n=1 Tax=Streptomyces sp. MS19 TaxID=3385972 RepID=UPI00399F114C